MEVHTTHSLCQQGSQCHQDYLEVCVLYRVKLTHSFNFTREEILRHIYELKP